MALKQEMSVLKQTLRHLEQGSNPSPSPAPRPPSKTLSITDIIGTSLAQQRSQSVASPSTPGHSLVVNISHSVDQSDADMTDDREDSLQGLLQPLGVEAGGGLSSSGRVRGALGPLLLEAENVMTNPMFGMDVHGMSVPATPSVPAPQLIPAVAPQQVGFF